MTEQIACIEGTLGYDLPRGSRKRLDLWINFLPVTLAFTDIWCLRECIKDVLPRRSGYADVLRLETGEAVSCFEVQRHERLLLPPTYTLSIRLSDWSEAQTVRLNTEALNGLLKVLSDVLLAQVEREMPAEEPPLPEVKNDPWTPFINSLEDL